MALALQGVRPVRRAADKQPRAPAGLRHPAPAGPRSSLRTAFHACGPHRAARSQRSVHGTQRSVHGTTSAHESWLKWMRR
eukprot:7319644-Alexandrium_andersonii.AAC.1